MFDRQHAKPLRVVDALNVTRTRLSNGFGGLRLPGRLPHGPAGFTLIELVIVLVILSILATVALQVIEPQVDQTRFEATQMSIQQVNEAIHAQRPRGDGRLLISGFYADMGRLPRAFAEPFGSDTVLTLRELWDGRLSVLSDGTTTPTMLYDVIPATAGNIANTEDSSGDTVVADSGVSLGMGWRGPYLKLPMGADRLRDGWGNDLVSFTTYVNSATYPHLRGIGDTDVLVPGAGVLGVRSLGSGDVEDTVEMPGTYERDMPPIMFGGSGLAVSALQLTGTVNGHVYVAQSHSATADDVIVQLYYPAGDAPGMLLIEQAEVSVNGTPHPTHDVFDFRFDDGAGGDVAFPVGSRVIRAYFNNPPNSSGDFGDGTDDPPASIPLTFDLFSTNNRVDLTVN